MERFQIGNSIEPSCVVVTIRQTAHDRRLKSPLLQLQQFPES